MHKKAMDMIKKAMEDACAKGYDCMTSKDWDDFKDCVETAEKAIKAEYYYKIIEEMEEYKEDEKDMFKSLARMFYPRRRDDRGRFISSKGYYTPIDMRYPDMHMPEWERDMDMDMGRMYYPDTYAGANMSGMGSGVRNTGRTTSRYGYSHDKYLEERKGLSKDSPEHKKRRMELLDERIDEMVDMGKEMVMDMTPEEKQLWKTKIARLVNM